MTTKTVKTSKTKQDCTAAVDELLQQLQHPQTLLINAIRQLVLATDPLIEEGVKWHAPSFRIDEYFATVHLRSKIGVGIILHLGAKKRELPAEGLQIVDPTGMLQWLAVDRTLVEFSDVADLEKKAATFQQLLRQWLRYL